VPDPIPMIDILSRILPKTRTIVSEDAESCMAILQERYTLDVLRYPSGSEYQTWEIPVEWNVRRAVLSFRGSPIASLEESALFVAPYSQGFSGSVTRDELIAHTFTNPAKPQAFCYEFRLAYNFQRRLTEWRVSMPHSRVLALPEGPFDVEIEVETRPGHMAIGVASHPGTSGSWFTLLAHYCHVGQVNDGIAGVVVILEVLSRLKTRHPQPRHGYKALVMPETIGSSVYAATHEAELDATIGAAFSEMAGASTPLQLIRSRRADTYIDRVFLYVLQSLGKPLGRMAPFRQGWGNDELVFDAPGVGVPAVSLDRYPFEAYHTHFDDMSGVSDTALEEMVEVFLQVIDVLEWDYIPRPRHRVPPYLTRYGLYSDWTHARAQYDMNALVLDSLWTGRSVLDIALEHHLDVVAVRDYLEKFVDLGLIDPQPVTPAYARTTRFVPARLTPDL